MGAHESRSMRRLEDKDIKVIASIDFGTKYTGYAFMLKDTARDLDVYRPQQSNMKREHTCILLKNTADAKFEFVSFGNKAMEAFTKLESEDINKFSFFRGFKTEMVVKDQSLVVKDHKGMEVNAEIVFTNVYTFVQSEIVHYLKNSLQDGRLITEEDILWIIAIPATWGYLYKEFIRNVAEQSYYNIRIVLEPEAASMFIRHKPVCFREGKGRKIEPFKTGQCYILVDIGAGTSDICAHKVCSDGNLVEICSSSGVTEGGEQVNRAFFNAFDELFTSNILAEQLCRAHKTRNNVSCNLLSGGLSESDYVYCRIEKSFEIPVIRAVNARNAVVEGALQMGLNPKAIIGRISPYTYGLLHD